MFLWQFMWFWTSGVEGKDVIYLSLREWEFSGGLAWQVRNLKISLVLLLLLFSDDDVNVNFLKGKGFELKELMSKAYEDVYF